MATGKEGLGGLLDGDFIDDVVVLIIPCCFHEFIELAVSSGGGGAVFFSVGLFGDCSEVHIIVKN